MSLLLNALLLRVAALSAAIGRKPIVLVDMDGVVYEWGSQFNRVAQKLDAAFPIVEETDRTSFTHLSGPGADSTVTAWALQHPELYTDGLATPGAAAALNEMRRIGFDVLLCTTPTWRNPSGHTGKVRFASDTFGDWAADSMIFTADKTMVFGDVIVDEFLDEMECYQCRCFQISFENERYVDNRDDGRNDSRGRHRHGQGRSGTGAASRHTV